MNRRKYITAIAASSTTALAGCSAIPGMGDSGPEYQDVTVEDLMLPETAFPDDWVRDDSLNENFSAAFKREDEAFVVLVHIKVKDTVAAAKEDYETSVNEAGDIHELDIGDEAYWVTTEEDARTLFRDSNVEAQTLGSRQSGLEIQPAKSRSQKYARELHDHMQSV